MSSDDIAIRVQDLSKCYQIYDTPRDRLKQFVVPRLQQLMGQTPKRYFRDFWALKNVSFEIRRGETVGIIGRNGSGKSTLLQIICGTLTPTDGNVSIQGRVAALLELGAGFNAEFTGRENILLNAAILGVGRDEMLDKMDEILAFSELGDFLEQPVKTYSSGMYVRLAFSIAIHVSPDILIIDEALAVGDARFQAKCMRRIKDIQDTGATILFVSHDISSIRTVCQRAIWLNKGEVLMQGNVFQTTGRFMEYMFQDDSHVDASFVEDSHAEPAASKAQNSTSAIVEDLKNMNIRPVTHWGSHKGSIVSAAILNEVGEKKDVFVLGEAIQISITVQPPEDIDTEFLSVAFSIKDLKGSDLIVSSTFDQKGFALKKSATITALFRMKNHLVTGKYLLVAALEDRRYRDIHYYEYVEGAHYFSSLSNKQLFGIFQPDIHIDFINGYHDRNKYQ